ncbi:hypothetical protein LTSEALA_5633 [Salmonella enterica subsp. enterica serovar Alachua str. R6-377]|uniref:Uncharacterized protein n=1 Tax=Salmonella enterica subsp. enterica serovar Alachua str. R6-377 TaxID=913241 RepID=G5LWA3_SALET|nr:hypothetical protein LTSEALA_5633 [Salmonella enterica subsp. enterica serovar Alachua str. R6-377]
MRDAQAIGDNAQMIMVEQRARGATCSTVVARAPPAQPSFQS